MTGPLAGVRVLEVGHMLAGPYCGLLLADLGAEVIKIESPSGDIARSIGPNSVGEHNVYFASLNRNKKSVRLDIGDPEDRKAFEELVRTAHAMITNLRPAAIRKHGLTYDALRGINERLVCVALTGYGLDSPKAEHPAYDYVIQALTGVMALTGEPDGPPTKSGYSAVDNSAGLGAALGLVAKLFEGKGGQIDLAMYDIMLSQLNYLAAAWLNSGERPTRQSGSAHPYIVPAQLFRTRDGHLCLFVTHDAFWRKFADEVGRSDWLTDPRFATMTARRANRALVVETVQDVLLQENTETWLRRLEPIGLVVSGVASLEEALASDQTRARGMIASISTESGRIQALANPIKYGADGPAPTPPPRLGEHNGDLLRAIRAGVRIGDHG
ncbi:MAG: CoA transferase [Alphaproteobacteria bacterium]|nr:CoA transferase [Alphaproteobacteria bacterium]